MDKIFICDIPEEESRKLFNIFEMKNTLESLAMQIAGNNDILKEDSLLYTRLIEDYKKIVGEYNHFWAPYIEKYKSYINENTELSIDFMTNGLFAVPKYN